MMTMTIRSSTATAALLRLCRLERLQFHPVYPLQSSNLCHRQAVQRRAHPVLPAHIRYPSPRRLFNNTDRPPFPAARQPLSSAQAYPPSCPEAPSNLLHIQHCMSPALQSYRHHRTGRKMDASHRRNSTPISLSPTSFPPSTTYDL
jgi:hypothetical protein